MFRLILALFLIGSTLPLSSHARKKSGKAKAPAAPAVEPAKPEDSRVVKVVRTSVFEKGKRDVPVFFIREEDTMDHGKLVAVRRVFTDPEGKEVVIEEATMEDAKLKTYSVDQKQLGEAGKVEVGEERVTFAYGKVGKLESDDESVPKNLISSMNIMPFLFLHRQALLKGEEISTRFIVLERKETIGFDFEKVEETKRDGKDVIVLKMSASNFLIGAIVEPLRFTVEKDTFRLLEMTGRAMPSKRVGDKWTVFEADHVYTYE